MSARLASGAGIDECRSLVRLWIALGVPAFTAVLALFWQIVYRLGFDRLLAAA